MTNIDRRRFDMLIRVRNFGVTHSQLFPTTSTAHDAFAVLAAEVEQLEALDVAERTATQAARAARKAAAKDALVDCLTRAGDTARVLAKTNAQLDAQLDLPAHVDDLSLVAIARQFVAQANPWGPQFVAHGIPIGELDARITAFDSALNDRGMQRDARVKARARIKASFQRALDAVETLDVTVANQLGTDAVALAVWTCDRRLGYPKRSRNGAAAEADSPAALPVVETEPAVPMAAKAAA